MQFPAIAPDIIDAETVETAWIFLGEKQTTQGIIGLVLSLAGAMVVQIQCKPRLKS